MPSSKDYKTKPLPFSKNLKGISDRTLKIHHDKLYTGYVKKMKEVGEKISLFAHDSRISGNQTYSELRALRNGETFANNGVYLHEHYFYCLGGDGVIQDNTLTKAITDKWESVEQFMKYFSASGMAMRGWVVLAWDTQLKRLKVYGCDAHNQGGVWGAMPIIVLDVYEHAYYLDYGSDRAAYIEDYWKNFNWDAVNKLFERVIK